MHHFEPSSIETVLAAREGNREALAVLISENLPLLYNFVGRSLGGHPDVDDVVQETVLRIMQGIASLRDPGAFRSWLMSVAIHQVRDHLRSCSRIRSRQAILDEAAGVADPQVDFTDLTVVRLALSGQRRELAEATRWLDPDDHELLALWWLEEGGRLRRSELAAALDAPAPQVAVRIQRMKERLDTGRRIVRVLGERSTCPDLGTVLRDWDGIPSPLWRKRLARHIRDCTACSGSSHNLISPGQLLVGLSLVPVPVLVAGLVAQAMRLPAAMSQAAAVSPTFEVGHGAAGPGADQSSAIPGGHAPRRPAGSGRSKVGRAHHLAGGKAAGAGVKAAVAVIATGAVAGAAGLAWLGTGRAAPAAHVTRLPPAAAPVVAATPQALALPPSHAPHKPRPLVPCKKGVATWTFAAASQSLKASRACWFYDWADSTSGIAKPPGVSFAPMIWGAKSVTGQALARARAQGSALLAFNEPDQGAQANMSVEQALSLWPRLESTGLALGSPAVATGAATPGGWLDRFMSGAAARGYRVDFITLHWYGSDFSPQPAVSQLQSYIKAVYARYHKPIWVTEYALMRFGGGPRYPSQQTQATFLKDSAAMMNSLPYVQRYAWFALPATPDSGTGLFTPSGTATVVGAAFQSLPGSPR